MASKINLPAVETRYVNAGKLAVHTCLGAAVQTMILKRVGFDPMYMGFPMRRKQEEH